MIYDAGVIALLWAGAIACAYFPFRLWHLWKNRRWRFALLQNPPQAVLRIDLSDGTVIVKFDDVYRVLKDYSNLADAMKAAKKIEG